MPTHRQQQRTLCRLGGSRYRLWKKLSKKERKNIYKKPPALLTQEFLLSTEVNNTSLTCIEHGGPFHAGAGGVEPDFAGDISPTAV